MMAKSNIVEINLERLHYLLRLFNLSEEEFMVMLNSGYKRELSREEVFTKDMSISLLKRIDKIFNKGIYYYIDFSPIVKQFLEAVNRAQGRNRTNDIRIFSPPLYQLSYRGMELRGKDLNLRPPGYEPDELPDCSTPRY